MNRQPRTTETWKNQYHETPAQTQHTDKKVFINTLDIEKSFMKKEEYL